MTKRNRFPAHWAIAIAAYVVALFAAQFAPDHFAVVAALLVGYAYALKLWIDHKWGGT